MELPGRVLRLLRVLRRLDEIVRQKVHRDSQARLATPRHDKHTQHVSIADQLSDHMHLTDSAIAVPVRLQAIPCFSRDDYGNGQPRSQAR